MDKIMDNISWTVINIIIGVILLFFILREVVCWYYKINERIDLQKQQIALLKKIIYEKEFVLKSEESNNQIIDKEEKKETSKTETNTEKEQLSAD